MDLPIFISNSSKKFSQITTLLTLILKTLISIESARLKKGRVKFDSDRKDENDNRNKIDNRVKVNNNKVDGNKDGDNEVIKEKNDQKT